MSGNEHVMAIREALEEAHNLTFEGDTIGIRRVLSGPQNVYLDALARELAEARELANTYSAALSMVEDCLADAAGDDTSINDIRQSLGLPSRDDMLPAPGDTDNQEAHPMDTLNDHAARISARIEEYRTLDLIGRNSADDLQHHLRALVAERDEARARAERWKRLAKGWEDALGER